MVVQTQQLKQDEQHPLLKVDTGGPGGGDTGPQRPPSTIVTPGWNVACVPKRNWLDRWPEFISACWMTLILLGITFLVFYALGMSAYRRQSLIIVKCNTSKPENNVYFHHIIPRGNYLPFSLYSDYLSSMAMEYPFLHFNVHFLIDDSQDSVHGLKHARLFKRLSQPLLNAVYPAPMSERDKQDLKMFHQRYGNINITIMALSHYMSMTPLRCKWKMIPTYHLPFYARMFSVWEYGGIGLDLISLNNQFNDNQMPDNRITTILRQHNDGIEEKKYIQTLNTINRQEQTEFFNVFYNLMTNIFAKTDPLFDSPIFDFPVTTKANNNVLTLSRNYRNKREISDMSENETSELKSNEIIEDTNDTKASNKKETDLYSIIINSTFNTAKLVNNKPLLSVDKNTTTEKNLTKYENKQNTTKIEIEIPHVILFYDFSVFPDSLIGPSYSVRDAQSQKMSSLKNTNRSPTPLSITYDGTFVATTSRHHPFLGHVLSSISSRISPRLAIENALSFQCPGLLRNDEYCDNIFIMN